MAKNTLQKDDDTLEVVTLPKNFASGRIHQICQSSQFNQKNIFKWPNVQCSAISGGRIP